MKKTKCYMRFCASDCGVRVNSALLALVPVLDQAQAIYPTLREHLPADVYSFGFVFLAVANILMRLRNKPKDLE
jgi:hypothetical protein